MYAIRSQYKQFSAKERTIADYILSHPDKAVYPSIDELADTIGISESTLVRFVRKIGFRGYQRFRIALATETVSPNSRLYETNINDGDDGVEVIFSSAISTLDMTRKSLNRAAIEDAVNYIAVSSRLLLFGLGGSNLVAQDGFHKFIRTGLNCTVAQDYHMQLMLASQTTPECAAMIVSHTGENMDIIAVAEELKENHCPVIVLTSFPRSTLAKAATVVLATETASPPNVSEAFSARLAHLVVIDTLYVELMKRYKQQGITQLDAMRRVIAKRKT